MNIETTNIKNIDNTQKNNAQKNNVESSVKFSDELKELEKNQAENTTSDETKVEKNQAENTISDETKVEKNQAKDSTEKAVNKEKDAIDTNKDKNEDKKVDEAIHDLNSLVKEFNQSDDKAFESLKNPIVSTDNNNEGEALINKDFNIQENKDLLPQMNPNMNFSGDGQPFSSFMNNEQQNQSKNNQLRTSAKDLAEEAAILSTMAENIAIANRNNILKENITPQEEVKTVNRQDGIKKVDTKTSIVIENVVKYDSIIMNQADVEVFAELVQKGELDIKNLAPEAAKQSIQVSKTLADMLAKSMETNQPLRIDFDNNISVIIRISRDGKISADFLPSSQVAEAYLKENLPLLRQKFDDNNIKYDELNQRERRENREHNRKKGRDNE